MKLATLDDGSRDGQLVVVSRDLASAHHASGIASRMQHLLDDWNFVSPQLQDLYVTLNQGKARHAFAFDPSACKAPLPRASLWAAVAAAGEGGSALPAFDGQGGELRGACAAMRSADRRWGLVAEPALAVVIGDLDAAADAGRALDAVRLLGLCNAWTCHALLADERRCGGTLVHSRPATAFSPVLVTPDEAGTAWHAGRLALTLEITCDGRTAARIDCAGAQRWPFGELLSHLARTRRLAAGTVVSSGALREASAADAEVRHIRLDLHGSDGASLFGAIEQRVEHSDPADEERPGGVPPAGVRR